MTTNNLTKDEIENVKKFVDYTQKRMNRLITLNQAQDVSGLDEHKAHARDMYLQTLQYASDKMAELFEDYKKGTEPTPFAIAL